ncbi:hypothetical protein ACHAPT_002712 [Fusarium lateritium]
MGRHIVSRLKGKALAKVVKEVFLDDKKPKVTLKQPPQDISHSRGRPISRIPSVSSSRASSASRYSSDETCSTSPQSRYESTPSTPPPTKPLESHEPRSIVARSEFQEEHDRRFSGKRQACCKAISKFRTKKDVASTPETDTNLTTTDNSSGTESPGSKHTTLSFTCISAEDFIDAADEAKANVEAAEDDLAMMTSCPELCQQQYTSIPLMRMQTTHIKPDAEDETPQLKAPERTKVKIERGSLPATISSNAQLGRPTTCSFETTTCLQVSSATVGGEAPSTEALAS